MAVPTTLSALSVSASDNSPAGSEAVFPNLDNYLRSGFSFLAQLRDSSLSKTDGGVVTGPLTVNAALTVAGLVGVTGDTTITGNLGVSGNTTIAGTLAVVGAATVATAPVADSSTRAASTAFVRAILPAGVITMWSGSVASIPAGWLLCDGSSGTPDLRDRFIVGAGGSRAPGAAGGAASAATDAQGAHTHGGATAQHTLTIGEMPAHTHTLAAGNYTTHGFISGGGDAFSATQPPTATSSTGGGTGHDHPINSDGAHAHTVATLPPFYALAFIIKT